MFVVSDGPTALSPTTEKVVYHTSSNDTWIYAATYPGVVDLVSTGTGRAYEVGTSGIWGLALVGDDLYVATERELRRFDIQNAADPGTIVADYWTGGGSGLDEWRGHMAYNPVDGYLYVADGFGNVGAGGPVTHLWRVDPSTGVRSAVVDFFQGLGDPTISRSSIAVTGDGAVWFMANFGGSAPHHLYRWDGTSLSSPAVVDASRGDALALDSTAVVVTRGDGLAYRVDDTMTVTAYPAADPLAVSGRPYVGWVGGATHGLVALDGSELLTFTCASTGGGPTVGYIGPGLMA